MGGGQAGAPADDDHVPWSRPPPGVATVTAAGHGAGRPSAGPVQVTGPERADARLRPERPMGGAGAKRLETAKGLRKFGRAVGARKAPKIGKLRCTI